jgi:tetratricopeptide (TPR) repeat protein
LADAKRMALRALELDPRLAEAHAVYGLAAFYSFEWDEAEKSERRALEQNPRHAPAHHWLALVRIAQGRFAEAVVAAERARALDPVSPAVSNVFGFALQQSGDLAGAAQAFGRTLELAPDFSLTHGYLAEQRAAQGRFAEAESEYARTRMPGYADRGRGVMYALAGRRAEALAILEALDARARTGYVSPAARGFIRVALGDKDQGYALLGQACAERDWLLWDVKGDPLLARLRAEPRFQELLRCMHIE